MHSPGAPWLIVSVGRTIPTAQLRSNRTLSAGFIEPCLPSPAREPPSGSDWLHEIKFDGYRAMVRRDATAVRLFTRRGYDWTDRFPAILAAARSLRAKSFFIDGEAVCCDDSGVPVFQMLRRRHNEPCVFLYAFDLLHLNGRDLRREPIEVRKTALAKLIRGADPGFQLSEHLHQRDGAVVLKHACKFGLEGIVPKRRESRYVSGRSPDWIKVKNPKQPCCQT
jgi:bifunctional non-homologous end joining protein LigD